MSEFKQISAYAYALPVLFKKTSTGALQFWEIRVDCTTGDTVLLTRYGHLDTSKIQETTDLVKSGKNVGKKNETTVEQQARLEALSKWESKLKEGYVKSKEDAQNDKVDEIIEGGVEPMLAQSFSKHGDKIKYPCYTQPKLDGVRCIAVKKGDEVTLWSRSRKRITSCPHIEDAIRVMYKSMDDVTLDGELYNHLLKNDFEKIISAVRTEKPSEYSKLAQYHAYDMIPSVKLTFRERNDFLQKTIAPNNVVLYVPTMLCSTEDELMYYFDTFKSSGFEGAMARASDSLYEHKRSYGLQKIKEFDDADFEVVGVQEGKGKLMGNVGAFVCKTSSGTTFEAKPKGDQDSWKPYLTNESLWRGKKLIVQYQGLTGKNKVPRFPIGLRLKDGIEG